MKIRNGFVSNSSSSSFIVIHEPIKGKLTDEIIDDNRLRIRSEFLSEGYDFFKPDELTRIYLKNPTSDKRYFDFYLVDRIIQEDEDDNQIEVSDVGKKASAMNIDHSATIHEELDFETFKERYIE